MSTSNAKNYARHALNANDPREAARYVEIAVNELCKAINDCDDEVAQLKVRISNLESRVH